MTPRYQRRRGFRGKGWQWGPWQSCTEAEAQRVEGLKSWEVRLENAWDASQIKPPNWAHVEAAFIEGAREARANPEADEAMFRRAADGYTKRVFEEVDPVSEAALRTGSWEAAYQRGKRAGYSEGFLTGRDAPPSSPDRAPRVTNNK